jgi:uncharacterized protein YecE (DUF72 family)
MIRIGTAGWTIPARFRHLFPESGSSLERYAARFTTAEINSTFYRSHRPQTYARWAAAVPDDFRFAVKLPKAITHDRRLVGAADLLERFLDEVRPLRPKIGPLLIQLPPSLAFDETFAGAFLHLLRDRFERAIVCEPRHATWFGAEADRLLSDCKVARVAADPARVPEAALPGGSANIAYFRLHGSPRMYYSAYENPFLTDLADRLNAAEAAETWCIFDNTASGAAIGNALTLESVLGEPRCAL